MPRRSSYSRVRGGEKADLPGITFRSDEEANIHRVLMLLKAQGTILDAHYEYEPHRFSGQGNTGNYKVEWDWRIYARDRHGRVQTYYLEHKGRLKQGGPLVRLNKRAKKASERLVCLIDFDQLAAAGDADSGVKARRFITQYPVSARHVFYTGMREYRWLKHRYQSQVLWEPLPKRATKAAARAA